jgi:NTE family protein
MLNSKIIEAKEQVMTDEPTGGLDAAKNIQPVSFLKTDDPHAKPRPGIGLCLSGGGYRAMLFHLGAVWRLNELGLLRKDILVSGDPVTGPQHLVRVSSVSGGSITAGVLGLRWRSLAFDAANVATNFEQLIVQPIRNLAAATIDEGSVLKGILLPRKSIADEIASEYRKYLFGNATLQDLPSDTEGPRFVINATNVQSKVLWRFSKPFMGDYRVGLIRNPNIELAVAVGASSAFPPFLSPAELKLNPMDFDPATKGDLQFTPYTSDVLLTDGGVYDNLGLETVWKSYDTILVSDGGGATEDEPKPKRDWLEHVYRVLNLLFNQVGSLRKRQVIASYQMNLRKGTYWGMRTNILDYDLPTAMNCPWDKTLVLANTPTRLKKLEPALQEKIINWGYAVCDAAIRKHVDATASAPADFPYPGGVG